MNTDKLIKGNAYTYKGSCVIYKAMVRLPDGKIAYSFRTRHGFVNLFSDQVDKLIGQ